MTPEQIAGLEAEVERYCRALSLADESAGFPQTREFMRTLASHVLTQQAQIERLNKALHAVAEGNPTIDNPEDDAAIARMALKGGEA